MSRRDWTRNETDTLITLVEQGLSYPAIAKRLKRSEGSIRQKCKMIGVRITTTTNASLSAHAVAAQLGISCTKVITRWIGRGWLHATDAGTGRRLWRITWDDLTAFMETPAYWVAWSPSRIPDLALREWATELRQHAPKLLTHTEVARRVHVCPRTIAGWIARGELPSVRYGNRYIPEPALVGFVPPCDRVRSAVRL